jgi:Ca-activated chloride channel family protein
MMENFRFQHIDWLYLLLIIPAFLLVYWLVIRIRKNQLKRFGQQELVQGLMPESSGWRRFIKLFILLLALASLIFALARPQFGSKLKEVKKEGIEIIIALDVSNSMLAEDIKPNRLERAKQAIYQLVERLQDDKIGLIVFAGEAYTQLPITTDYTSAKLFLSNVGPDIIPKQGTAIGSAVELASKSFTPDTEASKVIVVITDGENHEDDAIAMAREASDKGIKVYTIGMGLPKGAPVPVSKGSKTYLKDRQGNVVISKMNQQMLNQLAAAGEGEFFLANNTRIGLNRLYDQLGALDKEVFETQQYAEYDDQFPYFIWIALVLLIIDIFVLERKNKWLSSIKLFEPKK